MSWGDQFQVTYDVAGALQFKRRITKRTAVGPASYTQGTGIAVDLSTVFSTLNSVRINRVFVTATGADHPKGVKVHEGGADTFANRKFRLLFYQQRESSDIRTNAEGGIIHAVGVIVSVPDTATGGGPSATQADPDTSVGGPAVPSAAHTHTVNRNFVLEHDHTLTGADFAEVAAATNLSTITVEYEAVGVPV